MFPLSSYSPNLNLIERLWKYLKKNVCYNKYYEQYSEFRDKIIEFLEVETPSRKEELARFIGNEFHLLDTS